MKSIFAITATGAAMALASVPRPADAQAVLFLKGKKNADRQQVVPPVPPVAVAKSAVTASQIARRNPAASSYRAQKPVPPVPPLILMKRIAD